MLNTSLFRSTDGGKTLQRRRPGHARRPPRPVDRSRRLRARRRRQRRRRRDHLQRVGARSDVERRRTSRPRSSTTWSPRRTCRSTSAARSRTTARCACRATPAWAAASAACRRWRRTRRAAASPATSPPIATNPDVFFAGTNNGSFLTRLQPAHRRAEGGRRLSALLLRRAVEGRQGALAVDLPDHLLVRRSERALHHVAARVEVDQRRRHVGGDQRRPDAPRSEDDAGVGRPDHARHEQPGDLRDRVLAGAWQEGHQRDVGGLGRRRRAASRATAARRGRT